MFLPDTYPKELSGILDLYVKHDLPPSPIAVRYLEIATQFQALFNEKGLKPKKILDIGGRAAPYLYANKIEADIHEPRVRYHALLQELYGDRVTIISKLSNIDPTNYDCVLYNIECGGLGVFPELYNFNKKFVKDLPVYAYRLKQREDSYALTRYLDDGELCDVLKAQETFKLFNSHMHMGINSVEYENLKLFNLTRDY